jgi:hypothetical protein
MEKFVVDEKTNDNNQKPNDENFKIRIALTCLLAYFVLGWIIYCFLLESFTFTDATYFLMVTLTVAQSGY